MSGDDKSQESYIKLLDQIFELLNASPCNLANCGVALVSAAASLIGPDKWRADGICAALIEAASHVTETPVMKILSDVSIALLVKRAKEGDPEALAIVGGLKQAPVVEGPSGPTRVVGGPPQTPRRTIHVGRRFRRSR